MHPARDNRFWPLGEPRWEGVGSRTFSFALQSVDTPSTRQFRTCMEEIMSTLTRIMRWSIVPALAVVVSLSAANSSDASAQDMMDQGMMGNDTMGNDMMNTTVMVPMGPGSSDMMSVTVRMPMDMAMMMDQPTVHQVPGVGYEIDYGGPSIIIERAGEN